MVQTIASNSIKTVLISVQFSTEFINPMPLVGDSATITNIISVLTAKVITGDLVNCYKYSE